jgi:hypothetical protein
VLIVSRLDRLARSTRDKRLAYFSIGQKADADSTLGCVGGNSRLVPKH